MLVFDTSSLIHDPSIPVSKYPGEDIVIPLTAIVELDNLKTLDTPKGYAAREALRSIDSLREGCVPGGDTPGDFTLYTFDDMEAPQAEDQGDNTQGIVLEGDEVVWNRPCGGSAFVSLDEPDNSVSHGFENNDTKIIGVALLYSELGHQVTLVTQDRSMAIIAESLGVKTQRHFISGKKLSQGYVSLDVTPEDISDFYQDGFIKVEEEVDVNTGVIMRDYAGNSAIGISDGKGNVVRFNSDGNGDLYGCCPKGVEQKFATALLSGNHNGKYHREFLGALSGRSGSGKTTLALAAALEGVSKGWYDSIVVFRPTEPVGRDLGFIPGDIAEKMEPWTAAIHDVLKGLGADRSGMFIDRYDEQTGQTMMEEVEKFISVESVNFVRGRTFTNTFVIVDEAQNLGITELRTLASRCGKGSAFVCTFDPSQIDNAYLKSSRAEGMEAFLNSVLPDPMAWHIQLSSPIRGGVSALVD